MPVCAHNGCKKEFTEDENIEGACKYHPGAPLFHEGFKSWVCCADDNKPVDDFDEFMKIEGCTTGLHEAEQPKPKISQPVQSSLQPTARPDAATEVYGVPSTKPTPQITSIAVPKPKAPVPIVEEEDDVSVAVKPGSTCKRNGCKAEFVSDDVSRTGKGEESVCTYHPGAPIFHEGSKGYFCCKRRVLEFDEFLKIEGCKKGRHLFVPKRSGDALEEVQATCRIDHYQTPQSVCVSVFAKQTDKTRSNITFEEERVLIDLYLPGSKRFTRTLELYGRILPEKSSFTIMGTKVELNLQKKDGGSWNVLEKSDQDLGNFRLTFGVGGRTGTIGSKEAIFSEENMVKV